MCESQIAQIVRPNHPITTSRVEMWPQSKEKALIILLTDPRNNRS